MAEGIPQAPLFFELNTGAKMPSIGLGTWQAEPGLVGNAVEIAIRAGYRHIDCARLYCNEQEIGTALKKLFDEGVVKREDVWITSKLWNNDHAPEDVPAALEKTLQDLQLDYVDLYLMHWPFRTLTKPFEESFNPRNLSLTDLPATWKAMEKLYESGKARAIGVSNFSTKKLGDLLGCAQIQPSVVQVECHPVWHQDKLRAFCKQHGIHLSAYSPLGSPGTTGVQVDVLKNPVLIKVAQSLGKTPGQVALRWGLQKGHSVLPKSTKQARINENFDILDWSIPHDLFQEINNIEQSRLIRADFFVHELGPFKSVEEIWDGEV